MRQFYTLLLVFGLFSNIFAQNNAPNFWTPVSPESIHLPATAKRTLHPLASKTFELNYDALANALLQAPMEFTLSARQQPLMVALPQADGALRSFRIWESPVMAPELTAQYPDMRTYAGSAADGSGDFVRLGVGPSGLHAFMFMADGRTQSVRPYAMGQRTAYIAYKLEDLPNDLPGGGGIACGVEDHHNTSLDFNPGNGHFVTDRGNAVVEIKKYRIAIATWGEYSAFFGNTKPLIRDAIKTALNFIVAIQERDFGVRLELIQNNDDIIFLDVANDPYSGNTVGDWMNQNPGNINPIIGVGSYDIGHVFSKYVMGNQVGVANLGSTCDALNKARGSSSADNPQSEYFYKVAAHEMCHQLSGTHTWSNCPGSEPQISPGTAFEPGSGSTLMSYAGSCGNGNNVQGEDDPYYHIASILQVKSFVSQGDGSLCGMTITTDNNAPEATIALPNNLFIPVSTPFQLTGSATDADGDTLTYCWEQYDSGPTSQLGDPVGDAPSFRSFFPSPSPTRVFPRLTTILTNTSSVNEVLPDTSRALTFRMTVRDNHFGGGGGQDWAEIKLRATLNAGPFRVTYPNTNTVIWNVGDYETITWNVANTDGSQVNCKTVNILLSINGGNAFPITLASGVPNIGRYCIRVPNNLTQTARIRVEAGGNVFFDLSNSSFKIQQAATPAFSFCPESLKDLACLPADYTAEISTNSAAGFSDPITLSATGLPSGATATFSPNPVAPGSSSTMTIDFSGTVGEQTFDLILKGTANTLTDSSVITLTTVQNDFSALVLEIPANGAQSVDPGPVLRWNGIPDADMYEVQLATSPSFATGTILASSSSAVVDSFKVSLLLGDGQVYYWRVRPKNNCGEGAWTDPFVFVTAVQNCATLSATDLPKPIPTSANAIVESKITVPAGGALSDVNVKKVQGTHQFMKELEVSLVGPTGATVLLFKDKCGGYSGSFNLGFDDSGLVGFPCPPTTGNGYQPAQALSAFSGQNAAGVWTLRVKDISAGSGGQLIGFDLELCSSVALNAPVIVNNNLLQVMPGSNAAIGSNLLKAEDPDNTADQLTFTLVTVPKFGDLRTGGGALLPGAQFTQADINNGLLRYYEYGANTGTDDFRFVVTDGAGGMASGIFNIQPFPVGTNEPVGNIAFDLAPNPADESLRLFVNQPLDADSRVTLFNVAGQQLRSQTLSAGAVMLLIEVANLPEGVYVVSIENEKGKGVRKVVVR